MALVRGVMAASSASGLIVYPILFLRPQKNRRGIIQQRLILVETQKGTGIMISSPASSSASATL